MFFGHNVWTRNDRKPIKGPKNSDFSLVSTENLSQKFPPAVGAQGPITLVKKAWIYSTFDVTHKNLKPETFQSFSIQTRRLTASFEGLSSSLAQSPGELWSCKDFPKMGKLYLYIGKIHSAPKVFEGQNVFGTERCIAQCSSNFEQWYPRYYAVRTEYL